MAYKTLDYLITASWSGKQATSAASSDIAGVGKAAGVADPQVGQFSLSLGKLAVAAGGFIAAGVLSRGAGMVLELGRASLLAASDFEESYAKFNTVFGEAAGMAEGNLQEIADATGRSTAGLIDFAATLQDTFVPLGFARTEAAALSTELVGLALDLASFNNLDTDMVVRDLQSALVGNTETLRKYGVVANETTIKQYALSEGLWDGVGALDAQTKAQAILGITLASTTDAQGDAARTADGFANSTRGLQDAVLEAQIALGQRLLPTASELTQVLGQELVPAVADLTLAFVDSAVASDALQGNLVQTVESLADSTRYAADNYSTLRDLVGVLQAISQPVLVAGDSWGEFTKSIVAGNDALDEFRRSRDWGEKLQMAQGWIFDAAEGWVSFSLEVIHADGVLQDFTASLNEMRYAVGLLAGEFGSSGGGAKQGFVKGIEAAGDGAADSQAALSAYVDELARLAGMGRQAAESQQALDEIMGRSNVEEHTMALAREAKWLEAVAAGYTTAAGAIEALQAARKADQEARRTALGGEFVDEFDFSQLEQQYGNFYDFAIDNSARIEEIQQQLADKFSKPLDEMTEKQRAAYDELTAELDKLQERQGAIATAWDIDEGMVGGVEIMIKAAAAAGPATEQLYLLAGGTEAVGDAMLTAAANVRAAQLGELVGQGLITAEEAVKDLQDFMDNTTLEDLFSFDTLLPDAGEQRQSLRDSLLGPAEGIVSDVGTAVTDAAKPAKDKIQELIDKMNEADETDPDIAITDDDVTTATGHVTSLTEALTSLTENPWVVNVVYQTSGSIPGAGDGYSGGSGTYSPPPPTNNGGGGGAPGGSGPAGRGPATNNTTNYTTNNYWTNGVTPGTLDNALASYGRRSAGATR